MKESTKLHKIMYVVANAQKKVINKRLVRCISTASIRCSFKTSESNVCHSNSDAKKRQNASG